MQTELKQSILTTKRRNNRRGTERVSEAAERLRSCFVILGLVGIFFCAAAVLSAQNYTPYNQRVQNEPAAEAVAAPAALNAPSAAPVQAPEAQTSIDEVISEKAMLERLKPAEREERTYYPSHNDPNSLGQRFFNLLPPSMKEETNWKVDAEKKALTITGPAQVVATADQLIPRMDANYQLNDGLIDYGLAAPEATEPSEKTRPNASSEPYFDPAENRMVRAVREVEGAIFPPTEKELGMAVFGEDREAAAQGAEAEKTPDLVIYACSSKSIAVSVAKLKTAFTSEPEVLITSDPQAGKIIVYAPCSQQRRVRDYLASIQIYPMEPSAPQPEPSVANVPAKPAVSESIRVEYTPIYKNLYALEKELCGVFQSRLERVFPKDPNDASLSPAERERTVWRFVRRVREGDGRTPASCNIQFDPSLQKVSISGDAAICRQMKTLVESIDNSAQNGANQPYYILLRNADPNQIQNIFSIQKPRGERPSVEGTFNVRPIGLSDGAVVRGQEGALGDAGMADLGASEAFGQQGGPHGPGQLDLVPDYVPLVLPDLDMVILDAPDAEAKRIIEMIRKIEELAAEADPLVEIHYLKHVNSVMLGGVLFNLYKEMFATKQGRVMVYAMQYPNAILLVGWGQALTSMKGLIDTFDQPIQSEGSTIRVISLKYASATELARLLTQYFPMPEPESGGFAPRIRVVPDPRTNSLIIQASPNDFDEIEKIRQKLDVNKTDCRLEVKTIKLKNSLAEDLRRTISNAILPSMQGTLPAAEAKYPILEILTVDADSKKLIESGIMRDVQISADVQNQQLVITAPADCMELLEKLVQMLDVAPSKAEIRIFPIRYGDATQLQKTLQSILPTGGGSMPTIPNAIGETSFVPVRFSVDTRTNSILVVGAKLDLKIIDALIIALDRKDTSERAERVITMRNVRASMIATAVNQYLTEKQRLEMTSESISDHQLFDSQVIVVPEPDTNSIIISATEKYLSDIEKLVKSFDKEPAQVVIQVLIAEVTLTDDEEFGFEAGLQDSVAFDRSLVTSTSNSVNSATGIPGFDIIGSNAQGNNYLSSADPSTIAGTAVSTLNMGRSSSDLGYGGLVLSMSNQSVELLLRALREKNRLQILSRPQIQAMDNQQGFILIGQRVPRISQANMTNYGVSSSVVDANVGLILLVTPRISDDGRVIMEIGAEKSSLGSDKDAIPVFSSDGEVITSPTIDTTQLMTAVSAVNGETVMLGGLISTTKEKISRGVPYLSDIPVLGWLFRYDKTKEDRKELLIVMTPRVVRGPCDTDRIKRVEAAKMSWCLSDAMAMQGNMGLHDPFKTSSAPAKTKVLPFLDMDRMEEIPPSAIKPYNPNDDYPIFEEDAPILPVTPFPTADRDGSATNERGGQQPQGNGQ